MSPLQLGPLQGVLSLKGLRAGTPLHNQLNTTNHDHIPRIHARAGIVGSGLAASFLAKEGAAWVSLSYDARHIFFKRRYPTNCRLFRGSFDNLLKKHGRSVPISGVRYALKSPWACDQDGLGPSSRRRSLSSFFAW